MLRLATCNIVTVTLVSVVLVQGANQASDLNAALDDPILEYANPVQASCLCCSRRERNQASDFNAALDDHLQYLRKKREVVRMKEEYAAAAAAADNADAGSGGGGGGVPGPARDMALRPGQTIKVALPTRVRQHPDRSYICTAGSACSRHLYRMHLAAVILHSKTSCSISSMFGSMVDQRRPWECLPTLDPLSAGLRNSFINSLA